MTTKINLSIRLISLSLLSVLVSSCSLFGPDYKKPEVNVNQSLLLGFNQSAPQQYVADMAWWRKLNNSELNGLIESALAHNNNIQVAIGSITQAKGTIQKVNMAWVPNIGIGGSDIQGSSFNGSTTSSIPAIANSPSSQSFSAYNAGFVASYNLNIIQQIKNQDIAKANLEVQRANKNSVRMAIISQVADTYFNLLGMQEQLKLQKSLISNLQNKLKITQLLVNKGVTGADSVYQINMQISQAKSQLPQLDTNIQQLKNALMLLTNSDVPHNIGSNVKLYDIATNNIIPANLSARELESRPDIIIAENQLKVSNAQIGAMKANFFPSIKLTGNLGATGIDLPGIMNSPSNFWMAQAQANLPILNLSLIGSIKETKGQYYQAYYNYVNVIQSAFVDVNNKLTQNDDVNKSYSYINTMYSNANNLNKSTLVSYNLGEKSYIDTLDSNVNLINAKISLVQIKIKQLNSLVEVYQALGGGYNVGNYESAIKFNDSRDA